MTYSRSVVYDEWFEVGHGGFSPSAGGWVLLDR